MSSAYLNPIENPEAWDKVEIGDQECPGVAKLSGFKRDYGWDVKKGKGAKGATLTLNEFPPVEGTVTIYLWTPEHFAEWNSFKSMFNYDPAKKKTSPVDIYHPSLADIDCFSVVCKSIDAITHEGNQLYSVKVSLIEYNPPPKKSAVSTPSGSASKAKAGPGNTSDPVGDAQQEEIRRLLNEAKKP